jgi:hypothetical protein
VVEPEGGPRGVSRLDGSEARRGGLVECDARALRRRVGGCEEAIFRPVSHGANRRISAAPDDGCPFDPWFATEATAKITNAASRFTTALSGPGCRASAPPSWRMSTTPMPGSVPGPANPMIASTVAGVSSPRLAKVSTVARGSAGPGLIMENSM